MQFVTAVAIHAIHPSFTKMDISWQALIFAKVFIANPASMTGCAGTRHGWSAIEHMALK